MNPWLFDWILFLLCRHGAAFFLVVGLVESFTLLFPAGIHRFLFCNNPGWHPLKVEDGKGGGVGKNCCKDWGAELNCLERSNGKVLESDWVICAN
jgi:hypothetical protein